MVNLITPGPKISALAVILAVLGLLFPLNLPAQNDPVRFETLSLQKGVSLNLSYSIMQDSKGYIWFATMYGLVRYDGIDYTIYRNDPWDSTSISFDDITALFEDSRGNIWAGTWGGGLNKLDPATGKFTRYLYKKNDPNSICDNIIWAINEDKSGNIWIGTQRGGIDKIEIRTGKMVHYRHIKGDSGSLPANLIMKLYVENDGKIWVGTNYGLSEYLPTTDNFKTYISGQSKGEINPNIVHDILRDSKNRLLAATSVGLFSLDEKQGKLVPVTRDKNNILARATILRLAEDHSKNIWAGTAYYGLVKLPGGDSERPAVYKHSFEDKNSLPGNRVISLMVDRAGVLWASAYKAGISKITDRQDNFINYSYNPTDKNSPGTYYITFFAEDKKGNVWFVGYNSVLTKYNPLTNSFSRFSLVQKKPKKTYSFLVTSLALDNNQLWIGTTKGLLLFDVLKDRQVNIPDDIARKIPDVAYGNISYLLLTSDHKLWTGVAEKCIYSYDLDSGDFAHYFNSMEDLSGYWKNIAQVIYEDKKNTIWVGSLGGLLRLDQKTGKFKTYSHNLSDPKSLSNNYVYFLTEDSKGNFWIGTSNGLNRFDEKNGVFTTFNEKDGLPNSVIMSILEDKNSNLWISTNKGISRFDVDNRSFRNFDVNDGLSSNIFFAQSAIKTRSGRFYFGGNDGFTCFYPSNIQLNRYIPPVYITSLKAGKDIGNLNKVKSVGKKLTFPYNRNFFEINFASLDFTSPDKNVYKYKLDGIDENWVYSANNNTAVYTDLSPGRYTFRVMGSNSDGVWNEKPAVMELIIQPPFWMTWWFYSITVILILWTVYLAHNRRTRNKIEHVLRIEKIREEENAKVRKQAAIDFHDELGHRLTRISLLTEIAKRKLEDKGTEVVPLLRKISENSIQLYEGTKDFIWAIDPQNDSLYDLLIRLKDFGDEIFNDTDIDFFVEGLNSELEKTSLSTEMKRHLALIFKEGMHNSLKHSKSRSVRLESRITGDEMEITLKDDGSGFDTGKNFGGNGLGNMKKRAEKINGELLIDSTPGKGTSISFRGHIHTN